MKILFLSPFSPYPPDEGGRRRVYHIIERLRQQHTVDLVTFKHRGPSQPPPEGVTIERVPFTDRSRTAVRRLLRLFQPEPDIAAKHRRPEMAAAVARHLKRQRPDMIWVEESPMMVYLPHHSPPVILGEENIESELWRGAATSPRNRYEQNRIRHFEERCWQRAQAVGLVSRGDEQQVRQRVPQATTLVLENGVDTRHFVPPCTPGGPLLLVGTLNHGPNREGVEWFLHDIWPLVSQPGTSSSQPQALLAGKFSDTLTAALPAGLAATGRVPDIRTVYRQGAMLLVPLLRGGGSRLKILEAWAAGLPVISTTAGAAGLRRAGDHLLLADTPEEIAAAVQRLRRDRGTAAALAAKARHWVEQEYDWRQTLAPLPQLLAALGGNHAAAR